eukprot:996957-Prorocentrum_minimum.AAC.2
MPGLWLDATSVAVSVAPMLLALMSRGLLCSGGSAAPSSAGRSTAIPHLAIGGGASSELGDSDSGALGAAPEGPRANWWKEDGDG